MTWIIYIVTPGAWICFDICKTSKKALQTTSYLLRTGYQVEVITP